MLKTLPTLAALLAASAIVAPSVSQAAETDWVRVSFADLNLASDLDQARLQGRIAHAAQVLCGPADQRDIPFAQKVQECRKDTIADAQPAFAAAVAAARHPSVTVLDATALVVTAH